MIKIYVRLSKLVLGLFLFALGIVLTMKANLGFAPWDVFHAGIGQFTGLSIGNVSILVSLVILGIVVLLGEKLGLGSILNMILIGLFIDMLLAMGLFPVMNRWIFGVLILVVGLLTIALGSYFYIQSGFGAGPRDSLMVALKRRTGLSVGVCRGIIELSVVFAGWMLGGPVGLGTVMAAFGIGLCIQLVFWLMRFEATAVKHETIDVTLRNLKRCISKNDQG